MKKLLVVLLALAMVFGLATTAMAADVQAVGYSDVTSSTDYAADVYRLSAIGVLAGYPDGSFQAGDTITRAEFAKLACFLFGVDDAYGYYGLQKSTFADVTEGDWAEGYINCANANKLMIGVGANKFNPNSTVTLQEVATVVLRALGYVDFPGVWPGNYVKKAAEVDLVKYASYLTTAPATRGQVAGIFNDALDLLMVEKAPNDVATGIGYALGGIGNLNIKALLEEIYGDYADDVEDEIDVDIQRIYDIVVGGAGVDSDGYAYLKNVLHDTNEDGFTTMLEYIFGMSKANVLFLDDYVMPEQADANYYSEAMAWDYDDFEDGELAFYYFANRKANVTYNSSANPTVDEDAKLTKADVASKYWISFGDVTDLGGQQAEILLNDDDEVVYVGFTSDVTRYNKVSKDDAWGNLKKNAYGEIWYDEDGDEYFAKDFADFSAADYVIFKSIDDDTLRVYADNGTLLRFDAEDVADEVAAALDGLYFGGLIGNDLDVNGYVIYKDGAFVDWKDLKKGDVLYIMPLISEAIKDGPVDECNILFYCSSAKEGKLTYQGVDDDANEGYVTIDDVKYYAQWSGKPTSFLAEGSDWTWWDGFDIDEYADFFGTVSYAQSYFFKDFVYISVDEDGAEGYGVITGFKYDSLNGRDNAICEFTIKTAAGEEKKIPVELCPHGSEIGRYQGEKLLGALIEYDLNDDGEIYETDDDGLSFAVRNLYGAVSSYTRDWDPTDSWASDRSWFNVSVDDDDNTIEIDDEWMEIDEETEIFNITFDGDGDVEIEMLKSEDLLKKDFECRNLDVFYSDDDYIETLYIYDFDAYSYGYGFVTDSGREYDGEYYYYYIDGTRYAITDDMDAYFGDSYVGIKDLEGCFVEYMLNSDGELDWINVLAYVDEEDNFNFVEGFTDQNDDEDYHFAIAGPVEYCNSSKLDVRDGDTYKFLADATFFDMINAEALKSATKIQAGDYALLVLNENNKAKWAALIYDFSEGEGLDYTPEP